MYYLSPFFSIFYILMSKLIQITGTNDTTHIWPNEVSEVKLEISPQFLSKMGHNLILKKKNESLNLTCSVGYERGIRNDTSFDYILNWKIPFHVINTQKPVRGQARNTAWLWFDELTKDHSGNYTCSAINPMQLDEPFGSIDIYLSVKNKVTYCGSQWFKCRSKHCIMERYVCDGKKDCGEGEDESIDAGCGPNPCYGKVLCGDRCIPPEWCCDHRNCNTSFGFRPWQPETHEMNYVQTALYHTVVGWAIAFMFIVTILLIAICRVHMKRSMDSRWLQQNRSVCRQSELTLSQGINIVYNLDSVVQFIGRPVDPPPYSEVIGATHSEESPPTYESLRQTDILPHVPYSYHISCGKPADEPNSFQSISELQTLSSATTSASIMTVHDNSMNDSDAPNGTAMNSSHSLNIQHLETETLLSRDSNNCIAKISKDSSIH